MAKAITTRLVLLEQRGANGSAGFRHIQDDGWVKLCRGGKVIFALPDNGRDPTKVAT